MNKKNLLENKHKLIGQIVEIKADSISKVKMVNTGV